MAWEDARDYANSRSGDLASIAGGALPSVAAAFDPGSGYPLKAWLGAVQDENGTEPDEDWDWLDTEVLFQPALLWLTDEPDDGSGGNCPPTNCQDHDAAALTLLSASTHGLSDEDASSTYYGIIQRENTAACESEDTKRNYERTFAWQYRYDSPRARYMRRQLDPDDLTEVLTEWTAYDGNKAVSDFSDIGSAGPETDRNYLVSSAHADVDSNGDWDEEAWILRNQIGSTELAQTSVGVESLHLAYTAFGEEYDLTSGAGVNTRYRYAGQWGYQSHDNITLQHVGARWYDPATGRFLQRDPIGILGGLGVHTYAGNKPTMDVDPTGMWSWPNTGRLR